MLMVRQTLSDHAFVSPILWQGSLASVKGLEGAGPAPARRVGLSYLTRLSALRKSGPGDLNSIFIYGRFYTRDTYCAWNELE